jgi:signal transduction histidine kinase
MSRCAAWQARLTGNIRESFAMLAPDARQLREEGRSEAHRARYEQWAASHDRSVFAHIGIAAPDDGKLNLYTFDGKGHFLVAEWPEKWQPLRETMTAQMKGVGPPPSAPADSTLIEFPIFAEDAHHGGRGPELEWMIFEVSEDHLGNEVLPILVSEYLNPGGEVVYDASVSWAAPPAKLIFSTRTKSSVATGADATAGMFGTDGANSPGRRHGRPHEEVSRSRWTLAVRHRSGSLDAFVARTQTRNLLTSLILIGLLGGAAWALMRYTARSRRLAEMQFRFAAGVSHDLRTPLTAIRGAAFNLASGVANEASATARYGSLILRNAEELTLMIENVLAFSATLHTKSEERSEVFAVGDLIEHAAQALAQEIEQSGCRIEVAIAPELPVVVGDPVALELAFRNLIGNAVRHAAQGRWIGVSSAQSGDGVEVRVSDRGPGIPERDRARIFEPFVRGEQTREVQVRGNGLGLSLVKDTVERYRGTVSVHNSPGGGAQFIVHLPAVQQA